MTGRRLLIQILGWDFKDYSPSRKKRPQNAESKKNGQEELENY